MVLPMVSLELFFFKLNKLNGELKVSRQSTQFHFGSKILDGA